ncbi:hypothetical protein [Xanthobacter agilis]|uniref:Lipoprotein n=1 Tax=Xanthobacter agilis TaxID=47492 RepID=A0ABU0LIK4_XANAG|nr:hypothetical protein [Xanthobacter agilis]MDQ0506960.1 hypothetical protein [Xanthobacter agilis]
MTRLKGVFGLAAVLLVTACSSDRVAQTPANYDPIPPMMPAGAPPPVPEGPTVPRIEVRLPAADATLVRGRLATARRARGYAITVDQPAQLVAEKRLPPDEALKRTNGASSNAAFRLDYIFNTSGGAVTVSLEASIVTNPGSPGEVVRAIAMPGPDAEALKKEIADSV